MPRHARDTLTPDGAPDDRDTVLIPQPADPDPPTDVIMPVSAGERCACWHIWFAHDHAYTPLGDPGFGACLICECPAFTVPDPGAS